MNFSISRKAVKVLSLVLVLVMMTALFAGCKKDGEPAPESTEPDLNLNLNLSTTESQAPETEPSVPETTAPVISEKSATVVSQLNIRSAPSTTGSSVIGTLYAGDKVIVERREEVTGIVWAYISEPTLGWICMDFVEMDIPDAANNNTSTPAGQNPTTPTEPENEEPGTTTNLKGVVTANGGLMIRSEPSTKGDVKGMYEKGQVVTILETKNGWGRTNKGWIKLDYVNTSGNSTNTTTGNNNNGNVSGNGSTTVLLKGIVKVKELNIRDSASTNGDRVGGYTYGDRVEILEKDGGWGRTKKGWIHLDYVYQDGTTGTKTATGTVDANGLRLRSGPGTTYDVVGSLTSGQTVKILEQFTYGNTTWGCTKDGWVSMDYINTGSSNNNSNDDDDDNDSDGRYATITATNLRVRSGPGTDYDVVGSLDKDEVVKILDTTRVDGVTWGKISQGWISMEFVQYD